MLCGVFMLAKFSVFSVPQSACTSVQVDGNKTGNQAEKHCLKTPQGTVNGC